MSEVMIRLATAAMGTRFEVALVGEDEARLRAAGEEALEEIRHWHARLSWFDAGSFVSHLNVRAWPGPVVCDPEMFELLSLCREVWSASGGAFDPTVAALMRASGFRGAGRDEGAIAEARAMTGFDKVELEARARTVRFAGPGIGLDLGAIGKGWAIDRAARVLREAGVERGLIHGGTSSIVGMGEGPGGETWRVKVGKDGPVVALRELSLGVSEPGGREIDAEGARHGHVLDPRTGWSVRGASAAAVLGPSCAEADAWSTAVLVDGARPPGMPGHLTVMLRMERAGRGAWGMDGPHTAILIGS